VAATLAIASGASAKPEPAASAIESMLEPGPEARRLAQRAGVWEATITMWPNPGAKPLVWRNLIATRVMEGPFLAETIAPSSDSSSPPFKRIAYLHFNRVEGRWQYVSMDTRFPAGIMPAWSIGSGSADRIDLEFAPIAFPGWGEAVDGWMLRSSYVLTGLGTDHETAEQHWTRSDGSGRRWLAVRFDYKRSR
jgi:hypothetical protein